MYTCIHKHTYVITISYKNAMFLKESMNGLEGGNERETVVIILLSQKTKIKHRKWSTIHVGQLLLGISHALECS